MQFQSEDPHIQALRLPPHSIEAEQSLLGGLLIDNAAWEQAGDRYPNKISIAMTTA